MRSATAPADGLRPRPLLTVTIGIDPFNHLCQTAAGTVIAPGLLIPLLGDADIERIVYDPPNRRIEASWRRRFTGALRRIIEIRDGHCQHPPAATNPPRAATPTTSSPAATAASPACATANCSAPTTTASTKPPPTRQHDTAGGSGQADPLPCPIDHHAHLDTGRSRRSSTTPPPEPRPKPVEPDVPQDSRASTRAPVLAHQYRPQSHNASRTAASRSRSSSLIE